VRCPTCDAALSPAATEEDRTLNPGSVYAWTKRQQEELCQIAARTYRIPLTILRYFNVYGSGQSLQNPYTGVVSIFYARLRAGRPISLYEQGTPLRDFVHVSDVVRANLAALDADVEPGIVVNVGSGTPATIEELVEALAHACSRPAAEWERTDEYRLGDIRACYADVRRARRLLGWQPGMGLRDGLREFVRWAREQESVDLHQKAEAELRRHGLFGSRDRRAS
jgi:dTDP-L-rhamnose 4-epimerase